MRTWRSQSPNGWFPKLNPSGTKILFGFWRTGLANLTTGAEVEVTVPGTRLNPAGWEDDTHFIAHSETPYAIYRGTVADDLTYSLVQILLDPLPLGSWSGAEASHWAIGAAGRPNLVKDGADFRPDLADQYGLAIGGDYLVTARISLGYQLSQFLGNVLARVLPSDNLWFVNQEGDVTTGYYGPSKVYPIDLGTTMVDGTVTPWRRESPGWPVRVDGELWIWNASDDVQGGLVMGRRLGELNPIVLRDFAAVAVHARYQPASQLWVVAGNGDKGGLQVRWVPMDTPRFVLVQAPQMVAIGRAFWLGFFMFANGPDAPGNCTLAVRNITGAQARPVILTSESIGLVTGTILGYFCDGATVAAVEANAVTAAAAGMRPVAYWDARVWPSAPTLPAGSWVCVQAYCGVAESFVDFETSVRQQIAAVPLGYDVAIVAQCYTSNALNTADLVSLVPIYARLLRDNPRVVAILVFSGAGRATGYEDHPEVWPYWTTLFAGGGSSIPGVPGSPGGPGVPPARPFLHRRSSRPHVYRQVRRSPNRWI